MLSSKHVILSVPCSFLDYNEFVRELLGLPATPQQRRSTRVKNRPTATMNTGPYAQLLARNCERAAAPPARILSFFKRYDTDGSGQLSYDEMRLMVNLNTDLITYTYISYSVCVVPGEYRD